MDAIGQQVVHARFGQGRISEMKEHVVTVQFQQYGTRSFRYPEAFADFLTATDKGFAAMVAEEYRLAKAKSDAEQQAKQEHIHALVAQAQQERVAERKEKAATRRKRTS